MCVLTLRLPGKNSLKEKRQIVRSVTSRLRNKFNLAVAEVDDNDRWQMATIGMTCVSNNSLHARQMLENAVTFVQQMRLDAELLDWEVEVTQAF